MIKGCGSCFGPSEVGWCPIQAGMGGSFKYILSRPTGWGVKSNPGWRNDEASSSLFFMLLSGPYAPTLFSASHLVSANYMFPEHSNWRGVWRKSPVEVWEGWGSGMGQGHGHGANYGQRSALSQSFPSLAGNVRTFLDSSPFQGADPSNSLPFSYLSFSSLHFIPCLPTFITHFCLSLFCG